MRRSLRRRALDEFCAIRAKRVAAGGHLTMQPTERLLAVRGRVGLPREMRRALPSFGEVVAAEATHCFATHYSVTWMRCLAPQCAFCGGASAWRGPKPPQLRTPDAHAPVRPQPVPDGARPQHYLSAADRLALVPSDIAAAPVGDGVDEHRPSRLIRAFADSLDADRVLAMQDGDVQGDKVALEQVQQLAEDCCVKLSTKNDVQVVEYLRKCLKRRAKMEKAAAKEK